MKNLSQITAQPKQNYSLVGQDGEIIPFYLYYMPSQFGWFFNISYDDFILNGVRLTVAPNILYNYSNIIPFGIMCSSQDGLDPIYLDDFITGNITLSLLTADEVQALQ